MCRETGVEIRQVIGIDLSRFVTGYRAETLADGLGNREVVWSRAGVYRPVQYGFDVSTSLDVAKTFCRLRRYLSACRKQGVTAT